MSSNDIYVVDTQSTVYDIYVVDTQSTVYDESNIYSAESVSRV